MIFFGNIYFRKFQKFLNPLFFFDSSPYSSKITSYSRARCFISISNMKNVGPEEISHQIPRKSEVLCNKSMPPEEPTGTDPIIALLSPPPLQRRRIGVFDDSLKLLELDLNCSDSNNLYHIYLSLVDAIHLILRPCHPKFYFFINHFIRPVLSFLIGFSSISKKTSPN